MMSVASCDQPSGTSTSSILKTVLPSGLVMTEDLLTYFASSSGLANGWVKILSNVIPFGIASRLGLALVFGFVFCFNIIRSKNYAAVN